MPFIIKSPQFSFVEFGVNNSVCGGSNSYLLPAINLGIKFQINIENLNKTSEKLYVAICNTDCETIQDDSIEVEKLLTEWKFLQTPEPNELFDICEEDYEEKIETFDFTKPPYIPIPEGTDFILDIPPLPIGTLTPNKSTLIFATKTSTKIFVFSDDSNPDIVSTLFSKSDINGFEDLAVIRIKWSNDDATMRSRILSAFNDFHHGVFFEALADDLNRIAVDISTGIKIPGITESVGIAYDNINGSINQPPNPANESIKNFIYNLVWMNDKLYWFNFHRYYGNDWEGKTAFFSINNIDLTGREGTVLTVKFKYNNDNAFDVRVKIDIKDDGNKLAPTATLYLMSNTENEIIHQFVLPPHYGNSSIPFDKKGQITFTFDDIDNHLWENDLTFWIDDVEVIIDNRLNITSSINTEGYLPIPNGLYTRKQLYDYIFEQTDIQLNGCSLITCKELDLPKIEFEHDTGNNQQNNISEDYTITFDEYWHTGQIDYPDNEMPEGENCFKYCILNEEKEVITCSNTFRKETDDCLTTVLEYSNNENAFGFVYPNNSNTVRLPFFLHSAGYPTEEKVYRQSNGNYRRISAQIEKEYEATTDNIPEWLHDKLIIALKHDTIKLTTDRNNLNSEEMMQQGNYEVEWKESTDLFAKAKFKVRKVFDGINSNCNDTQGCK